MKEQTKAELRLVFGQVDLDEIKQEVKKKISDSLQGVTNPEEAFKIKLFLDAVDEVILQIEQIADQN